MVQSLLADRFKLVFHRGTAVRAAFELVLANGKPRLKEQDQSDEASGIKAVDWSLADGKITGHAMPISTLASDLQSMVRAFVVDKTALTGRYDIDLKWDPRSGLSRDSSGPSIFTALEEQLGLRLKPIKIPVETVVIDHLAMPSDN